MTSQDLHSLMCVLRELYEHQFAHRRMRTLDQFERNNREQTTQALLNQIHRKLVGISIDYVEIIVSSLSFPPAIRHPLVIMGLTGSTTVKENVHYDAFEANLPSSSVRGKTVAITGCTSGTGLIAAQFAARKGAAHILMLNRPSARAEAAEQLVKAAIDDNKDDGAAGSTTTQKTHVETIPCDLQDFASVRQCTETIRAKYDRLDVLCNNAGVMALEDKATKDGYDIQMQTNHLSHFLLTSLLLPLLTKSGDDGAAAEPARIVFHSSMARNGGDLQRQYFGRNGDGNLGGNGNNMFLGGARWERYHQTKLANYVMTAALADKIATASSTQNIMAVCAAPGLAATNLQTTSQQDGGMGTVATWVMRFAQSAEDGAMPLIHAMFDPNVANGDFYEPKGGMTGVVTKYPLKAQALNESQKKLLWEASEEACGPFGL
jgi:NAD(P)-dependent dehydrogenase (short-subunit alcohol dehydrogenase family)